MSKTARCGGASGLEAPPARPFEVNAVLVALEDSTAPTATMTSSTTRSRRANLTVTATMSSRAAPKPAIRGHPRERHPSRRTKPRPASAATAIAPIQGSRTTATMVRGSRRHPGRSPPRPPGVAAAPAADGRSDRVRRYHRRPVPGSQQSTPRPSEPAGPTTGAQGRSRWRSELETLDLAVYAAVAASPTPRLDRGFTALSRAADHSKLWIGAAGILARTGGRRGRRAALTGLASTAVASAVVNLALKPLGARRRPDRVLHRVPIDRHVAMPRSTSFPSGHSASAFAFAAGVAHAFPAAGLPLHGAATLVAYSRVHTGVHYPIDAIVGSVVGSALTPLTTATLDHWEARRSRPVGPLSAAFGRRRRR
jgi:membrane-associated phospholipid phosphatase